ncbi:DsbA family protein [Dyadobacter chenhuakuii]|uniref:DsbA family protein n=1 Tax=Dyadobacter chenhuakuii TaxID=2909339 RepID=A0ABY4XP94_9BACT|nr:DsbA family protein [Dyadobacter chenhuakuii]MCF2494744.1 DsbA family protein [Dyadobacter chenhuakuii]USJ31935.1 DsbA family protein [Dyadobacter chenhuakuii]
MYVTNSFSQPIKIVYYTYPLCQISWGMQESWRRLVKTYGDRISFQFCLARENDKSSDVELSSYSACLAVKAAGLQSPTAADLFLNKLREAAMEEKRDISRVDVLVEVAREVNKQHRGLLDLHRFGKDFDAKATRQALHADLEKIHRNRIDSFPTITMTLAGKGLKLAGHCSYQRLTTALHKLLGASDSTSQVSYG